MKGATLEERQKARLVAAIFDAIDLLDAMEAAEADREDDEREDDREAA